MQFHNHQVIFGLIKHSPRFLSLCYGIGPPQELLRAGYPKSFSHQVALHFHELQSDDNDIFHWATEIFESIYRP